MCFFSRPKPPELPKPEPKDSPVEETASSVVIGDDRDEPGTTPKPKPKPDMLGTSSLQIPLNPGIQLPLNPGVQSGNLNYPT